MIPSTMQAAVYHGVNDVRLEEVPVAGNWRGEILRSSPYLRHLRDRSEENCHRLAFRAANFWSRDFGRGRAVGEGVRKFAALAIESWCFITSLAANVTTAGTKLLRSVRPTKKWAARRASSHLAEDLRNMSG